MVFNNLNEIYASLEKLTPYIAQECGEAVGKILHEESKNIYKEYIPSNPKVVAQRRYDNEGFADKRNIKVFTPVVKGLKCSISVRNIAKARGSDKGKDLDRFIEYGIYNSPNVPARPAYERTKRRIVKEKIIQKAINKALADKGWI